MFPNDFKFLPRAGALFKECDRHKTGQWNLAFIENWIFFPLYLNFPKQGDICFFTLVKGMEMDVGILADSKYLSWHMLFSFLQTRQLLQPAVVTSLMYGRDLSSD